jgi:sugar phosphate isomerase/epimerase
MRYAICNETFGDWPHERVCATVAELGYTGLEVAPFTLAPLITDLTAAQRRDLRRVAESHDLTIFALHWLLAKTTGFYLNSPDPAIQKKTGLYLADLAIACADLGGSIMVLGSPKQRDLLPGVTMAQADDYACQTLSYALGIFAKTGVTLALEPLGPSETNYWNTAAETVSVIDRLSHPHVRLHLDVKAMCSESIPISDVIRKNIRHMVHFHANDPNLRGPGMGEVDFTPIFAALKETGYAGWVSVEPFDYSPDPLTVARESIAYMKRIEAQIG